MIYPLSLKSTTARISTRLASHALLLHANTLIQNSGAVTRLTPPTKPTPNQITHKVNHKNRGNQFIPKIKKLLSTTYQKPPIITIPYTLRLVCTPQPAPQASRCLCQ